MEDELYYINDKRIYNHKLIENDDYEPNKECTSCDVEYTCWDCEAEQIRERYPEARYTDHLEWIVPDGTNEIDLLSMFQKKHLLLIYQLEDLVRKNKKMICTKEIEKLLKKAENVNV
jgi:hypothetical protein